MNCFKFGTNWVILGSDIIVTKLVGSELFGNSGCCGTVQNRIACSRLANIRINNS